jgi:hypothetical protein
MNEIAARTKTTRKRKFAKAETGWRRGEIRFPWQQDRGSSKREKGTDKG